MICLAVTENLFEIVNNVFSRGDTLAHPKDLAVNLQAMSTIWAIIFIIAGLVCMLNGFKFYKAVTVILALMIGGFAGYSFGKRIDAAYIVAGCLAALFAVACWPMMKYAVALMGGLAGAFIGANVWSASAHLGKDNAAAASNYWIGALIGLMLCGMLAFVLFKLSVVLFTSVSGATIAVLGAMALLLQVPPWRSAVTSGITAHQLVMPLLVFVPAAIGLILQHSQPGGPSPVGGGGGGAAAAKHK